MKTLTMDNGSVNGGKKITVMIDSELLEYEAKKFFRWRTPTKNYATITQRLYQQGSSNFDQFILHLANNHYEVI